MDVIKINIRFITHKKHKLAWNAISQISKKLAQYEFFRQDLPMKINLLKILIPVALFATSLFIGCGGGDHDHDHDHDHNHDHNHSHGD